MSHTKATHYRYIYGEEHLFKQIKVQHLNHAAEEWQELTRYEFWTGDRWYPVGRGFDPRNLKEI
jgi:hypothetical protein